MAKRNDQRQRFTLKDRIAIQFGIGPASQVPRLIWIISGGDFILSTGHSLIWPLMMIYVHLVLGRTMVVAGLVLMLQAGMMLIGQLVGGRLFDRFGGKPVMIGGLATIGSMLAIIGLIRIWPVFVAAIGILGFCYGIIDPATNGLVAQAWPNGGRKGFNLLFTAKNAGVGVGTAIGGLLASISFKLSFLIDAGATLVFLVLVSRLIPRIIQQYGACEPDGVQEENAVAVAAGELAASSRGSSFRTLVGLAAAAAGATLNWLAYSQWQSTISIYMQDLGYPLPLYSLLWTINGVVIVAGQPIVANAMRLCLRELRTQLIVGSLLLASAFLIVWKMPVFPGFVAGMIVLTLGEMLVSPGIPTAAAFLATPGVIGIYQGILGGAASAGRMLGPISGGKLYSMRPPQSILALAALACLIASACYWLYGLTARSGGRSGNGVARGDLRQDSGR